MDAHTCRELWEWYVKPNLKPADEQPQARPPASPADAGPVTPDDVLCRQAAAAAAKVGKDATGLAERMTEQHATRAVRDQKTRGA